MKRPGWLEALGLTVLIFAGMIGVTTFLDFITPSGLASRMFLWFLAYCCLARASWDSVGWKW